MSGRSRESVSRHCPLRCRRVDGFTYVEMLVALVIAAALFAPAYRFAVTVLGRAGRERGAVEETDAVLDVLARDLRCATTDARQAPFYIHAGRLRFTRSSPRGPEEVDYEFQPADSDGGLKRNGSPLGVSVTSWNLRFFDGEIWRDDWGWNADQNRPSDGVMGLPLAIDVSVRLTDGGSLRRVVPVMTAVINRWTS